MFRLRALSTTSRPASRSRKRSTKRSPRSCAPRGKETTDPLPALERQRLLRALGLALTILRRRRRRFARHRRLLLRQRLALTNQIGRDEVEVVVREGERVEDSRGTELRIAAQQRLD